MNSNQGGYRKHYDEIRGGLQAMLKNWKKNLLWLLMAVSLMLYACNEWEIVIRDGNGLWQFDPEWQPVIWSRKSFPDIGFPWIRFQNILRDPLRGGQQQRSIFSKEGLKSRDFFESYGDLDGLGRCTGELIPWWEPRPCQQRSVETSVR